MKLISYLSGKNLSLMLKTFVKTLSIALLFSLTKALAYSQVVDLTNLPTNTTGKWQVYLQAPKQELWQGQASHWFIISLNSPSGTARVNLPKSENFTLLANKAVAINSKGKIGWAYPIQITPKNSGSLTIPAVSLSYPTKTLATTRQQVVVNAPQVSDRMQLDLSVSQDEIYIGQSIRLTTSWTFDFPVNALKEVSLHLPSLLNENFTVATPWDKADKNKQQSIGLPVNGQRQIAHWQNLPNNQVRIWFETVLKATTVGQHRIAPATLIAVVVNKNEQPSKKKFRGSQYLAFYNNQFFNGANDQELSHRVLSQSNAIELNVKALPNNAPSNFSGIIGRPIIEVSAQPTKVKQGQAIQYSLTVIHGDIETITLPELAKNPSFTHSFNVPLAASKVNTDSGSKIIKQSLFPRRADIEAIPAFTINYFEPQSGLFRDLTIDSLPILVEENDNFNFSDIEGNNNIKLKNSIKPDADGVWALRWQKHNTGIKTNTAISTFFSQTGVLLLLLLLPPVILALFLIKPMQQRLYLQRIKQPVTQLKMALKQGKDPLLHLSKYCYLRFGLIPSKFNARKLKLSLSDYLKSIAENKMVNSATKNALNNQITADLSLWLEQYQTRYAPQESSIYANEVKQLLNLIDKLEQCLPRYNVNSDSKTKSTKPSKMLNSFASIGYMVLLGFATHSEQLYAKGIGPNELHTKVTIENLHHAHQQALQLSIDSPHKGNLAHGKIAEQLASFVDDPSLNQASLFYDIGTSWFQAGRYGQSILWLRRAQNLTPDDDIILHNLAQARIKRLDQLPDNFAPPWLSQMYSVISSPVWLTISWLGYCLFWLIIWRRLSHKDLSHSNNKNTKLWFILIFICFASVTQIARFNNKPRQSEAVVTSQEVVSRKGPGLIFSPAFTAPLHAGAELVILKTDGQWSEVKLTNGEICWLPSRVITVI
ncbi:BatD family protein [Colwellia piezophila]|uniref:BatD family protein n=1 Tax=Colwellia piezophila TaxID=211668 RepID=UPI0003629F88|nr:BatD family protein [Colwellia piezophila]